MRVCALIVAGGRGSRLGGALAKQYLPLGGRPVLAHTLSAFATHPRVSAIKVVIHPDDRKLYDQATAGFDLLPCVSGGASRQESVLNGLNSLADAGFTHVVIHDAARPFVAPAIIDGCLDALADGPGAIAAVPLADSLKRGVGGLVRGAVDRAGLWRAQTPQAFDFAAILEAHRAAAKRGGAERGEARLDLTDDAAVAELAGLAVRLVQGSEDNFKITTVEDMERAERLIIGRVDDIRVGTGFDVHAFAPAAAPDKPLMLCGIAVPHDRSLAGHSDADVALHALTDAVLGAIGEADIGAHFPPSDPRWRGVASETFLRHAMDLVAARGGLVAHLDVTVICERPKVGPLREAMRARLAEITGLPVTRVSVKATTTEKLGFTGRGEGIAAQAVATVRLP